MRRKESLNTIVYLCNKYKYEKEEKETLHSLKTHTVFKCVSSAIGSDTLEVKECEESSGSTLTQSLTPQIYSTTVIHSFFVMEGLSIRYCLFKWAIVIFYPPKSKPYTKLSE